MEERGDKQLFFLRLVDQDSEACFPVPMEFVQGKFIECGRIYRESGKEACKTNWDIRHR